MYTFSMIKHLDPKTAQIKVLCEYAILVADINCCA